MELSNAGNSGVASTAIRVHSGNVTATVDSLDLPAGSVDSLTYRPKSGALGYHSTAGTDPELMYSNAILSSQLEFLDHRQAQLTVKSIDLPAHGGFVSVFDSRRGTVTYRPSKPTASADAVSIGLLQESLNSLEQAKQVSVNPPVPVTIPAGGYLRWNYLTGNPLSSNFKVDLVAVNGKATGQRFKGQVKVLG